MSDANELPPGWALTTISNVAETITGNTPSTTNADYYGGETPFIKPPQLVDRPIVSTDQTISHEGTQVARLVPESTVLVSCIGLLGKTGITTVTSAFNQQINAAIFGPAVDPRFGFYQCQTIRPYLESVASATTVSIVNKG